MKKVIFIGATMLLGMMMVCTSVDAQTRKEKKAAKAEAYKNEQRRIQEEKELIHQVRMDSIANAKKEREKAEAKREAEARAKEVSVEMPCTGDKYFSTNEILRASANRQSQSKDVAKRMATTSALNELASKIAVTVKSLAKDYLKSVSIDMDESLGQVYESMTKQIVNQRINSYKTICEKYTSSYNANNKKIINCYICVEVSKDDVLKPIYEEIQANAKTKLEIDYEKFSAEFEKEFAENERDSDDE